MMTRHHCVAHANREMLRPRLTRLPPPRCTGWQGRSEAFVPLGGRRHRGCIQVPCSSVISIQEREDMQLLLALNEPRRRVMILCLLSFLAMC